MYMGLFQKLLRKIMNPLIAWLYHPPGLLNIISASLVKSSDMTHLQAAILYLELIWRQYFTQQVSAHNFLWNFPEFKLPM